MVKISEFTKNFAILFSGTAIAQLIAVGASVIISRVYTTTDIGILALFISIVSIFSCFANLRYELAILLPKKHTEAINIVGLGVIASIITGILVLLIIYIFYYNIESLLIKKAILENKPIEIAKDTTQWLYLVPLIVVIIGWYNVLNYYNTRLKTFKIIARANIAKSLFSALTQIGLYTFNATGLIIGYFVSFIAGNVSMLQEVLRNKRLLKTINPATIKRMAFKYKKFPLYSMPAILSNTIALQAINIFLLIFFTFGTVGLYFWARKMLELPVAFIGKSIGQVYFQSASEEKQNTGRATISFNSTLKKLVLIAVPSFLILYFISEELFAFVFGENFRIAGIYAQILMPYFFANFITTPLTVTNSVFEKQKLSLIWQIGLLLITLSLAYCIHLYNWDITYFLRIYSYTMTGYYLFLLGLLKLVANKKI